MPGLRTAAMIRTFTRRSLCTRPAQSLKLAAAASLLHAVLIVLTLARATAQVQWAESRWAPFSEPFKVLGWDGQLWIQTVDADARWTQPLLIKGANWFGFQSSTACVHELWKYSVQDYIDFLVRHKFNAVRLPLSTPNVAQNPDLASSCGEYAGRTSLAALDDVVLRLRHAGILVMLGMHSLSSPEKNNGLWCTDDSASGMVAASACTATNEQPLIDAWQTLAQRYCDEPNVVAADLFNEPHQATWGEGDPSTDWDLAAERLGNKLLHWCPRWLIVVQGIGNRGGACKRASGHGCWWAENVLGQLTQPIQLSDNTKLVLSPHVYGHGVQDYMDDDTFPLNMPPIWDAHFGMLPAATGIPILVGEWGGVWVDTEWRDYVINSTAEWQQSFQDYLQRKRVGFFYWSLNDNSFRTGSLYDDANAPKWEMLEDAPALSIHRFQVCARLAQTSRSTLLLAPETCDSAPARRASAAACESAFLILSQRNGDVKVNPCVFSADAATKCAPAGGGAELCPAPPTLIATLSPLCAALSDMVDVRSLEPAGWCNSDSRRRQNKTACESAFLGDGVRRAVVPCQHNSVTQQCRMGATDTREVCPLCAWISRMTDVRALQPQEWCHSDRRSQSRTECESAYATLGETDSVRVVQACAYNATLGRCKLSGSTVKCEKPTPPMTWMSKLCDAVPNMVDLRALAPAEWCNTDLRRRHNATACELTFIGHGRVGVVVPCQHHSGTQKCRMASSDMWESCPLCAWLNRMTDVSALQPQQRCDSSTRSQSRTECEQAYTTVRVVDGGRVVKACAYDAMLSKCVASPSAVTCPTPLPPVTKLSPLCAAVGDMLDMRSLDPPEWCNTDSRRRQRAAACESAFLGHGSSGAVVPCQHDSVQQQCRMGAVDTKEVCPLCAWLSRMTDVRALQPPEGCDAGTRSQSPTECKSAYVTQREVDGGRAVQACAYNATLSKCVLGSALHFCEA